MSRPIPNHEALLEICRRHILPGPTGGALPEGLVFPEPYLPWFPDPWNGVLVLAEAQILSVGYERYVTRLKALGPEGRLVRLKPDPDRDGDIGVGPWEDGSVKLALEAAMPGTLAEGTAVSNAVPWSLRDQHGNNVNPTDEVMALAEAFWRELMPQIMPRQVVCVGKVAEFVLWRALVKDQESGPWRGRLNYWRHPSQQAMSRVSGMFDPKDLLRRYPEVADVLQRRGWSCSRNQIFYACHAVSLTPRRALHEG
jgi:hypothetical protein